MFETAYQTVKKYTMIQKGDCIIVGISGGADSISLFHFLCSIKNEYNIDIVGVHIHHGIRGIDADTDANYVKELCDKCNVICEVFRCDIHKEAKRLKVTEEEAGRIIRYKIFNEVLIKYNANKIAVAHNMNDQSETLLMRIFRGTGLRGLTGISPIRDNIIRPLIECTRYSIEKYCIQNKLEYKQDYTNDLDIYTRNKIRLHLIPWIIENFNPSIIQTLSKMSSLLQEEEDYIESQAIEAYNCCIELKDNEMVRINLNNFKKHPIVIQKRILRIVLQNFKRDLKDIEFIHIIQILELLNKNTGKKINITDGIVIEKQYNNLCFYIEKNKDNINYCYDIKLNGEIYVKEAKIYIISELKCIENFEQKQNNLCTKVFDYDKIGDSAKIRTRYAGDKIYLKSIGTKKLKDFFIDIKLPREQRDTIPLLAVAENIIWILGYRTSSLYNVDENTKRVLCIKYKK